MRVLVYGTNEYIYSEAVRSCNYSTDLYGKGYSEAPQTAHHVNLFITQLALLMQYVRWDSAHIVGFSMVRRTGHFTGDALTDSC